MVAHDLRAPVRTGRLLADRLLANLQTPDELVTDLGDRLDDALRRVDEMILSMLDYSALRGAPPELDEFEVAPAVRAASDAVVADLEALDATIDVDIASDMWMMVNPDLLQRVLINLLTNAVKYRRPDVRLEVSARALQVGRVVRLQVVDNGRGIPPEHRERVFGLLERLDDSATGLGFGLAICRRAIESCGGRIWIEPTQGPGTTVTMELTAAS